MFEKLANRGPQRRSIPEVSVRRLFEPLAGFRFAEMENQVVGSEAGDIAFGIEAGERIIEIVREKYGIELRAIEHLLLPVGLGQFLVRSVVERFPIAPRDLLTRG